MKRCIICGWPLKEDAALGCVEGDCSYRPNDPAERAKLRERRQLVNRATLAVRASWAAHGEVPFPLYEQEARRIATDVIRAYEAR